MTNAQYQPQYSVIHGTTSGVTSAPMLVPGVEDAGGERPLLLREPLGDDLDRGRKVARLAEPEREPREDESGHRGRVGRARRAARIAAAAGPKTVASACAIAARLQTTSATVKPFFVPSQSIIRPASRNPIA